MKLLKKINSVDIAILFLIIIIANININLNLWKRGDTIFKYDVNVYYSYLPATFIYKDISFKNENDLPPVAKKHMYALKTPNGGKCIKTSMGMAMLYSPFFAVAHFYALHSNYDANGYTLPYKAAMIIGSLFYLILGLFFLKLILLKFFSKSVTIISIYAMVLGTNMLYNITHDIGMPHAYNFSLIAVFLYFVIRWHEKPTLLNSIFVGLIGGLISLIRPVNFLIYIIFLFYNISSLNDLKNKFLSFFTNYKYTLLIIGGFLLVWLPQFIYWKHVSGKFLYFSYGSSEKFFFANPQIINGLFSYRNGWLIYTPIMIFSLSGIFFLQKKLNAFLSGITLYFLLFIYISFSWWCWWYVGFGNRTMIDTYSILAIPFAAYLHKMFTWKKIIVYLNLLLIAFLVFLNIFQANQFKRNIIHFDGMTKKAYWSYFLRKNVPWEERIHIESPDYALAHYGIQEVNYKVRNGKYSYVIDSLREKSQMKYIPYEQFPKADTFKIKIELSVLPITQPTDSTLKLVIYHFDNWKGIAEKIVNIKKLSLITDEWYIFNDTLTLYNNNSDKQLIRMHLEHKGEDVIFVDELKYTILP